MKLYWFENLNVWLEFVKDGIFDKCFIDSNGNVCWINLKKKKKQTKKEIVYKPSKWYKINKFK